MSNQHKTPAAPAKAAPQTPEDQLRADIRQAYSKSDYHTAVNLAEEAIKKNERSSLYHQWLSAAYSLKGSASNPLTQMTLAPELPGALESLGFKLV